MHTTIHSLKPSRGARNPEASVNTVAVRTPHYDCQKRDDGLRIVVYVPGVTADGVEITTRGPDLLITARKRRYVRVNFQALHLERVQRDYQLSLRLGRDLDFTALRAEIAEGLLTVTIPQKQTTPFPGREALSCVA